MIGMETPTINGFVVGVSVFQLNYSKERKY